MKQIYFAKSTRKDKKYMVKVDDKVIHFGARGYQNYGGDGTERHLDEERKRRYILRHKPNEDWTNMSTAGFWSKHLLWNKDTLDKSIKDVQRQFGIKIIVV